MKFHSFISLAFFVLIPGVLFAQSNPPIFFSDANYKNPPDKWSSNSADASHCKGFSAPGVTFAPSGYAEIEANYLNCFGTQTLTYSNGSTEVREAVWATHLSCGATDQSINASGKISNPRRYSQTGEVYSSATCYCYQYLAVWNGSMCVRGGQTIAFTGGTVSSVRPDRAGGIAEATFQAKVTQGVNPVPGVALSFSVEVTPNSGGHEHHDGARPKGSLSKLSSTTDANGEVQVTFKAPEIAGIHTIKATCATCSNSPVTKEIQVKVPDLLPISPNPPRNTDGTFVYALTSVDKTHQGNGRYHVNQYYLTEQSQINLQSMIAAFAAEGWGTVALNDASLYWGGRYDISANWAGSHKGHREGREIDISFSRAGNPISASKQSDFYDKFCKNKKVSFPFSVLHHYVKNPHFHVYLEKQTACWTSEK